jgi:hypothetical protein
MIVRKNIGLGMSFVKENKIKKNKKIHFRFVTFPSRTKSQETLQELNRLSLLLGMNLVYTSRHCKKCTLKKFLSDKKEKKNKLAILDNWSISKKKKIGLSSSFL